VADTLLPEREFSIVGEGHEKRNIPAEEVDEYIRLSFRCAALRLVLLWLFLRSLNR